MGKKRLFTTCLAVLSFGLASTVLAGPKNAPSGGSQKTTATQKASATLPPGAATPEDIRKLLSVTGSDTMALDILNEVLVSFKTSNPGIPAEFWENVLAEVKNVDLTSQFIPIYQQHLTHTDVIELCKFYESPVGQKYISVLPAISKDSMKISQQFAQGIVQIVKKKMDAKGY